MVYEGLGSCGMGIVAYLYPRLAPAGLKAPAPPPGVANPEERLPQAAAGCPLPSGQDFLPSKFHNFHFTQSPGWQG